MLIFNNSGLLVPDKKIVSNIDELEYHFVDQISSKKRKKIFENFQKYNEDFKEHCELKVLTQWIDGSFVTRKQNPGDIDLVTFINTKEIQRIGNKIYDFVFPNSEKIYGVDGYVVEVYPKDHKENFKTISDSAYWNERFTKTRRNRTGNKLSKGFLEILV